MKIPNAIIDSVFGPIIINVNDWAIGRHIVEQGAWAADDISLMRNLVELQLKTREQVVFYDVGANIGTHSLALAKIFGQRIKIRAFEAQRIIHNMLCGTMAINGLANVWCHHAAVSDGSITAIEIALPDYHHSNNFGSLELLPPVRSDNDAMPKSQLEIVACVSIDAMSEQVDFLKLDIEGMEDKAIVGATKTIDRCRPVCFIEVLKTDAEAVQAFFAARRYAGFRKENDVIMVPLEYGVTIQGLDRVL
jgi:FkbM family methyltransferase